MSLLDKLRTGAETAVDYMTPDVVFGNVGKIGSRAAKPYQGRTVFDLLSSQNARNGVENTMPQNMTAQAPTSGGGNAFMRGLGVLDRVLGGQTITDAMESQRRTIAAREAEPVLAVKRAEEEEAVKQARMMLDAEIERRVSAGDLSPQDALMYRIDPKSFAQSLQDRQKPQVLAPGSGIYAGGQSRFTQPIAEKPVELELKDVDGQTFIFNPKTGELKSGPRVKKQFAPSRASGGGSAQVPPGFVLDNQ